MKEQNLPRCTRCKHAISSSRDYHDGTLAMSSVYNRRDLFGEEYEFVTLCEECYAEYHLAMKAWMEGYSVTIKKKVRGHRVRY